MKIYNIIKYTAFGVFFIYLCSSCEKFLDERMSHASKVATSLSDLQALLDAENFINIGGYPFLLEVGTDDYEMNAKDLSNLTEFDQKVYKFIWTDLYPSQYLGVWVNSYKPISISNLVLESLDKLGLGESKEGLNIRGQALFHRAYGHFMLAQVFCLPYDKETANTDLGIPIRHSSDANIISQRSTVQEVYTDILRDMHEATELLNESNSYLSRPDKASAFAALSRIYLTMELYNDAELMATKSLSRNRSLIDLNTINVDLDAPYRAMNEETLFFAVGGGSKLLNPSWGSIITSELLNLYEKNDLRLKTYFKEKFDGSISFKGNYMGFAMGSVFSGLTTSEVLLNRAESYVRNGKLSEAREDLNRLLIHRIRKDSYREVVEEKSEKLLGLILDERRKELVNRSIRWIDLRRLNKDDRFKKTLVRTVLEGGISKEYKLPPDSKNYVYKIPKDVIDFTGMQQN